MTISFSKHADGNQPLGIKVFDVEIKRSANDDKGKISLREYVEKARNEFQPHAPVDQPAAPVAKPFHEGL